MASNYDLLLPENFYHLYNRAVGNEQLFKNKENYIFFLRKIKKYILPVSSVYSYCLLPNHFHFFIRINAWENIIALYERIKGAGFDKYDNEIIGDFLMEQFSNCCNSYTKSFNKVYHRKGKLFMDHLHRIKVEDENYFTKIIHYIHANPVHHGYCKNINDWLFSSYNAIISNVTTEIQRNEILQWFSGKERFIAFHQQPIDPKLKLDDF